MAINAALEQRILSCQHSIDRMHVVLMSPIHGRKGVANSPWMGLRVGTKKGIAEPHLSLAEPARWTQVSAVLVELATTQTQHAKCVTTRKAEHSIAGQCTG